MIHTVQPIRAIPIPQSLPSVSLLFPMSLLLEIVQSQYQLVLGSVSWCDLANVPKHKKSLQELEPCRRPQIFSLETFHLSCLAEPVLRSRSIIDCMYRKYCAVEDPVN